MTKHNSVEVAELLHDVHVQSMRVKALELMAEGIKMKMAAGGYGPEELTQAVAELDAAVKELTEKGEDIEEKMQVGESWVAEREQELQMRRASLEEHGAQVAVMKRELHAWATQAKGGMARCRRRGRSTSY